VLLQNQSGYFRTATVAFNYSLTRAASRLVRPCNERPILVVRYQHLIVHHATLTWVAGSRSPCRTLALA